QIQVVTQGGTLVQSTRRWDDVAGVTEEMRTKEHAHDYRYFPEPDLMPFAPRTDWLAEVKSRVVELPLARKQRFIRSYQLPAADAEVFKNDVPLGAYFEGIAGQSKNPKAVANWIINDLRGKMAEAQRTLADLKFRPECLLELIELTDSGRIHRKIAQEVFADMFATGAAPAVIVETRGLAPVIDLSAIERFCDDVIAANPGPAGDFKAGKAAALNFLKGQVMRASQGKADPALVGQVLERKLK